ncbi:MAG: hypothetical protein KBA54_05175 [Candidatus Cloacimonetes bacterium]|nr:hypothetical protein [Candidatus Cloacimonadota bacterium]
MEQAQNQPPYQNYQPQAESAPVLSMGSWVGTLLLMFIPLVNIILPIVWAVSNTENPNRRNFARAYLIMFAISLVLIAIILGAGAGSAAGILNQLE